MQLSCIEHTKFYLILAIFTMLIQYSLNDAWLRKMNGIQICRRKKIDIIHSKWIRIIYLMRNDPRRLKSSRILVIYLFFTYKFLLFKFLHQIVWDKTEINLFIYLNVIEINSWNWEPYDMILLAISKAIVWVFHFFFFFYSDNRIIFYKCNFDQFQTVKIHSCTMLTIFSHI